MHALKITPRRHHTWLRAIEGGKRPTVTRTCLDIMREATVSPSKPVPLPADWKVDNDPVPNRGEHYGGGR